MVNHQDIVQRVRDAETSDAWKATAESILAVLLKVIGALPRDERGGLLRKDSGENIAWYPPRACNVSISRVCYPDGKIWKVFTDAGPGGQNGAAWNDDGFVEPLRYLEIVSTGPIDPPPPPPSDEVVQRVTVLEGQVKDLTQQVASVAQGTAGLVNRLGERVDALEKKPAPPFELPELVAEGDVSVRVWGREVSKPHVILPVKEKP